MISFLLMYSVKEYACVCLYTHCNKTSVACSAMAISVKPKSSDLMCLDLKEKKRANGTCFVFGFTRPFYVCNNKFKLLSRKCLILKPYGA